MTNFVNDNYKHNMVSFLNINLDTFRRQIFNYYKSKLNFENFIKACSKYNGNNNYSNTHLAQHLSFNNIYKYIFKGSLKL